MKSKKYYKMLVYALEKRIKDLSIPGSNPDFNINKEILLRDLLSRAYYTAFLHCRDVYIKNKQLPEITDHNSPREHSEVIKYTRDKTIKDFLFDLKLIRQAADYITDQEITEGKTISILGTSIKINLEDTIKKMEHIVGHIR